MDSTDSRRQSALDLIQDYRDIADLCAAVKSIIQAFDGKIYNCRVERALQELGNIHCEKKRYLAIYTWTKRKRLYVTLCSAPLEDALQDGKRLNADALLEDCNLQRAKYLQKAYDIVACLPHVEEYRERFSALERAFDALRNEIPRDVQEIFHLSYHLTNY